jgi:hypothetical protein
MRKAFKRYTLSVVVLSLVIFEFMSTAIAWDNQTTHRDLSRVAAEQSILSSGYLQTTLGIKDGLSTNIHWPGGTGGKDKSIREWIRDGADFEDVGGIVNGRFYNHFHNPLQPWPLAGLNDYGLLWTAHGESALLWAQNAGGLDQSNTDWSWQPTRQHYYLSLTAPIEADRDAELAQTFVGLGHQIHLIQDMSQPAHVRNDAHPEDFIGSWLPFHWLERLENWAISNRPIASGFMNQPTVFPTVAFNTSVNGLVPITSLWDTDTYSGIFPIPLDATNVGLAEYTNSNFFSDDTINSFEPRHQFPFPSVNIQDYSVCADQAPPGSIATRRWYISRGVCPQQGPVDHFLASSFLPSPQPSLIGRSTQMDSRVFEDYARDLLPRAVGYSAGLLNYFFRGQLDIVPDPVSGSGYVIVNNTDEDLNGTFQLYYDTNENPSRRLPVWSAPYPLSLGAKSSGTNKSVPPFGISPPGNAEERGKYILVFSGRLGGEEGAVVGRVVQLQPYLVIMKVDHTTRETLPKEIYQRDPNNLNQLLLVTEAQLPFGLMDDGAYWDPNSSSWTAKGNPQGLGVPLGVGGPQSIAKYWDVANQRVRFILNGSYEKEAYDAFHFAPKENGQVIKDMYYLTFVGSAFGKYSENPGWMDYTSQGLLSILSPPPANPQTRFFSLYKGANFNDIFVQAPVFRFYNFDNSIYESAIPKDPEAPTASIVSAYRPNGTSDVTVSIPTVFNTYVQPNQGWTLSPVVGSSGMDNYQFHSNAPPTIISHENKCIAEDNNCGNVIIGVVPVFDIPYNDNSYVRIHFNDGGQYYEELYIHGQLKQTSTASPDKLATHYQILAAHKDTAVIRETNLLSEQEVPMDFNFRPDSGSTVYEMQKSLTARYYIYVNGAKYNLTGTTNITNRFLTYHTSTGSPGLPVDYLTFEPVEDITGYHLDRIFIGESSAGSNILIAFDEYTYNNGAGLVHSLHYELSNLNDGKHILYYDIPLANIQNADHEGTRVGRKLLLFGSDGSLQQSLQDPIGLNYTIGSIGILN